MNRKWTSIDTNHLRFNLHVKNAAIRRIQGFTKWSFLLSKATALARNSGDFCPQRYKKCPFRKCFYMWTISLFLRTGLE